MSTKWPTGYTWRVPPDLGAHTPMYGPADFQIMCELTRPIYAPPPLDDDEAQHDVDAQYTVPKAKAMAVSSPSSSARDAARGVFNRPPATMKGKGVFVPPPPPPAVIPPARQTPKAPAVIGAPMKTNKAAGGPVPPRGPPPSDLSHGAAVGGASRFLLSVQHTCKWCTAIYC